MVPQRPQTPGSLSAVQPTHPHDSSLRPSGVIVYLHPIFAAYFRILVLSSRYVMSLEGNIWSTNDITITLRNVPSHAVATAAAEHTGRIVIRYRTRYKTQMISQHLSAECTMQHEERKKKTPPRNKRCRCRCKPSRGHWPPL